MPSKLRIIVTALIISSCYHTKKMKTELITFLFIVSTKYMLRGLKGSAGMKNVPLSGFVVLTFEATKTWRKSISQLTGCGIIFYSRFLDLPSSTSFCYTQTAILLQQNFRLFELSEVKLLMLHKICFI